jgi:hypothetical protein
MSGEDLPYQRLKGTSGGFAVLMCDEALPHRKLKKNFWRLRLPLSGGQVIVGLLLESPGTPPAEAEPPGSFN